MRSSSKQEPRPVAIATAASGALEGLFVAGADSRSRGALIAPPHPLYGGSMEAPVVNELAWACARAGMASLCFNWRGVGASAGRPSGEAREADEDCASALAHLEETVSGPLVACGYSWGAAAVARAAPGRARVAGLILVAPPPSLIDLGDLAAFAGPLLLVAGAADAIAPARELERLAAAAARAELVLVPEADHFFHAGLAQLSRAAAEWLERS